MIVLIIVLAFLRGAQPSDCDPRGSVFVCADALPVGALEPYPAHAPGPARAVRFGVDFATIKANPLDLPASCLSAHPSAMVALCE